MRTDYLCSAEGGGPQTASAPELKADDGIRMGLLGKGAPGSAVVGSTLVSLMNSFSLYESTRSLSKGLTSAQGQIRRSQDTDQGCTATTAAAHLTRRLVLYLLGLSSAKGKRTLALARGRKAWCPQKGFVTAQDCGEQLSLQGTAAPCLLR